MPGIPLKRMTSTKRSNSASWIKNAAKSLGMIGVDVLADLNPTIAEVTTTSMKTSQEIYKQVRTGNLSSQKVSNAIKGNRYVKLGQTAIKNALEDLKSGNFNNQERFNQSLFGGDDDSGMNFGDFDNFRDDDSGSEINTIETGLSQESVAQLGEISQRNTEAIVKSAQATVDANIGMATASMMQIQEIGNKINGKLDTANNHLAALVEFNNANMLKFIESSTAYYEKVGAKITEEGEGSGKKKLTAEESFLGKNGGINFKRYGDFVNQQMKDYIENSQAGMLADIINNFGDAIVANPLQMVSKFAIESAIPEMVKNTMEEVDQAMSGAMTTLLQRLGNKWGNDSSDGIGGIVKRFIGNSFGLTTKNKESIELANKVTGEPATFDGYTHHAINELIPKYLRESTAYLKTIAETLTGDSAGALKSAEVFDYKSGSYKTVDQVQKEVYREIRDNTALAVRESAFGKAMGRAGMAASDSDDYNNALNDFLYRLSVNGTPDFSQDNWMDEIDGILGQTSGTDNTKAVLRAAVESSVEDRNSGATMAPGLLAGQAARNRTLQEMENNATGYNLYATTPTGENVDITMATVLYASESGDDPDVRIRKHGSIADVLDNINYLLERGINVRNTGKNPYPEDHGLRPNKRGIPTVANSRSRKGTILNGARAVSGAINNLVNGGEEQPNPENPENAENATADVSEEEIREQVRDMMQENPEDETVKGFAGRFQKLGKGIVGGIYDILQGNLRGGFKQISESAGTAIDPTGKLAETAKEKLFGKAKVDENGDVVTDENGNVVKEFSDDSLGKVSEKLNTAKNKVTNTIDRVSNMKVSDVKEGVMEFLFGHKVEDLPPQMLYKIYGKRVEAGQRLGSKNGVIRAVTDTFRDGMYGFYESFFGDEINPNDPPSKIRKQMKEGIQKKFHSTMESFKAQMPDELLNTMKTVKAGAGRGAAGGAIGFMLGGPLGAVAGASLGIFSKSEMYQDFMFGKEVDGKRDGGFKKKVYDAWEEFKEKHHIGDVDPKTGKRKALSKTNKMALTGAGLGFLASAFLPVGPVGGAIAGLTLGLAAGESKIHEFLFGKKTKNSETGEEEHEKGLLGRIGSIAEVKLLNPIKNGVKYALQDATDFVKDNVLKTISIGLSPIMTSMGIIFEDIRMAFKKKLDLIGDTMKSLMSGLVGFVDKKLIGPLGKFINKHILNSSIGRFVKNTVGGALDKLNPVKAAQRFNEKRSLQRRITELQDIADNGSPEEAEAARKKLALLQAKNPNDVEQRAQEEAKHMYYDTDYRKQRLEQLEDRGARKEQRRAERTEDAVRQRNTEFIVTMTGGRLTEDTEENREAAMAEFQKGLKGKLFGRKFKGYKKDFQFQDYIPETGNATEVDTAIAETASNTEDAAETLHNIEEKLAEVLALRQNLTDKIIEKKNTRKENGDPNYKAIDDEDSAELEQLNYQVDRLTKKQKKAKKKYKRTKLKESINYNAQKAANFVKGELNAGKEAYIDPVVDVAKDAATAGARGLWKWGTFLTPEDKDYDEWLEWYRSEEGKREREMEALKKDKNREEKEALLRGKYREQDKRKQDAEKAKAEAASAQEQKDEYFSEDAEPAETDSEAVVEEEEVGGNGNLRGYARGTKNATPGPHVVGEKGPEILHIPKGSHVDPNDKVLNVRITEIDKKGWKKFVKLSNQKDSQLKVGVGSSTDILPVYTMGTLGSETANVSRILGQVQSDGNIKVDAIDDDIMDDRNKKTDSDGKGKEEEKEKGWFENAIDKIKDLGAKAASAASVLGLFGSAIPGILGIKKLASWIETFLGKDKKSSNSNENTAEVDENGVIQLNEDGTVKQYDATEEDKKTGFFGRLINRVAPKRTIIDPETGVAETRNDFNNESFNEVNHIRGAIEGIKISKTLMPKMAAKVAKTAASGKGLLGAGAKALTGIAKTGESIIRGTAAAGIAAGEYIANSTTGKAVATVADGVASLITAFKAKIGPMVDDIIKLLGEKLGKTSFGKGVMEKVAPKITKMFSFTDDVLKAGSTKIAEFMGKIGSRANAIGIAIEVGGIVIGGVNGLTSMGYMFDVDPKDPNIGTFMRGIMTGISTALGAFQGSSIGAFIDLCSSFAGIELYKWLGNVILDGALTLFGQKDAKEGLEKARQNFQKMYEDYSKAEWEAACKNAEANGQPAPSYEDFIANDYASTSFEEFNNDYNANLTARAGDWVVQNAGKIKDVASKLITSPVKWFSNDTNEPTKEATDAAIADSVDSTDTTASEVESGMGGFGNGVPYYSQNDPRWKNAGYGTSDNATMGDAGCGPTAMAMAASKASGKNINPMQMAGFAQQNGFRDETGTNSKFVQAASDSLGLDTKATQAPDDSFLHDELSKGKPVVLLGKDGGYGNSAFTKAGHYVVATGETPDGKLMINDPRGKQFSGKYDKGDVLSESAKAWSIGGKGNENEDTGASVVPSPHKALSNAIRNTVDYAVGQAQSNGLGVTPDDVIAVARNEIGYTEKASNSQLDVKEANPGNANWTKYGEWMGINGQPWCASFVCWCFAQAANGDKEIAKQLLCGPLSAACAGLWDNFTKAQRTTMDPQKGDVIFYSKSHVGIVADVVNGEVITIEGNTSAKGSRDGTIVKERRQPVNASGIKGYGRPMYDTASDFKGILPASIASVDGTASTTADGTGVSAKQTAASVLSSGLAGLFDGANVAVKNFWENGEWSANQQQNAETSTGEVQYDENGNPIGAVVSGATGISGMDDIDAAQFTSDIPHAEAAFKYFLDNGYSPAAAAGILGNLMHESGGADLDPTSVQKVGGHAAGIAQWERYDLKSKRWKSLEDFAAAKGKQWTDFGTQVEFIDHELNTSEKTYFKGGDGMTNAEATPTTFEEWKQSQDVEMATRQFEGAFERAGKVAMQKRLEYAKGVYNKFVGMTMNAKDVTSEDAQLTSVGDLRRQEAAARQDTTSGAGGYGDMESDLEPKVEEKELFGGFGPTPTPQQTSTPTPMPSPSPRPSQPTSTPKPTGTPTPQNYTASKVGSPVPMPQPSGSPLPAVSNGIDSASLQQVLQYLQAIAENTGVSANKLDYLKNMPTGTSLTQNTSVYPGGNTSQSPPVPPTKTSKQEKAERIARG